MSRVLPKILSKTISTFKYDHCVFRACKEKKNTARVFFSKFHKINSITFEQSYGLINEGAIGIQHWRNFGTAIGESLETLIDLTGAEVGANVIKEYLKEEI